MSITNHIKEHNALGVIPFGTATFTVGPGGLFTDVDSALSYIETLTGMIEVPGSTGTVTATQNNDTVTGAGTNFQDIIQAGDLINMSGDGVPAFIAGDIYFPIYGNITTNTELRISCGFAGTTGAGKTYSIWRPVKYSLLLLPGFHQLLEEHEIPLGMSLNISGAGKTQTILDNGVTTAGTSAIKLHRGGYLNISDLMLSRSVSGSTTIFDRVEVPPLEVTFLEFSMSNIEIADITDAAGNVFFIKCASINISNVSGNVYAGLGNFSSDGLIVNNLNFKAYEGGADVCVFSDAGQGLSAHSNTKPKVLDGIACDRELAFISGAGALIEIQGLNANRVVDATNLTIRDHDQQGSSNPHCLLFNGFGTGILNVRNSIIQEGNAAVGGGGIISGTAGDNVYLYGVYGDAGAAVTTEGSGTFTTVY